MVQKLHCHQIDFSKFYFPLPMWSALLPIALQQLFEVEIFLTTTFLEKTGELTGNFYLNFYGFLKFWHEEFVRIKGGPLQKREKY